MELKNKIIEFIKFDRERDSLPLESDECRVDIYLKSKEKIKEPKKENFGWVDFALDGESGWMIEGGEEAYFEALERYNNCIE